MKHNQYRSEHPLIHFAETEDQESPMGASATRESNRLNCGDEALRLANTLIQILARARQDEEGPLAAIRHKLFTFLRKFHPWDAAEIYVLAKEHLTGRGEHEQLLNLLEDTNLNMEIFRWSIEAGLFQSSFEAMVKLKHHLTDLPVSFEDKEDIRCFGQIVQQNVRQLLRGVLDQLGGYVQFRKDLGLELAPDSRRDYENSIALESIQIFGARLFDWREIRPEPDASGELDRILQDLMLHQLALLAGYKQAVKGGSKAILQMLSPTNWLSKLKARMLIRFHGIDLNYAIWPLLQLCSWQKYVRTFEELSRNKLKDTLAIYKPHFEQGYYEILKEKSDCGILR